MKTAALLLPLLLTVALHPASNVVVLPTLTVAALQGLPVSHLSPLGIPKLNIAAQVVQLLLTVAQHQGLKVEVVPTFIVAALPVSPFSPFGIPKFNTAL